MSDPIDDAEAQAADLARQSEFYREHPRVDAEPDEDDLIEPPC